ncbi:IS1634 family transposase, partial [Acinetobacter baumannii]
VALPRGFGFEGGLPEHQHLLRAMDVIDDHADAINERLAFLMRPLIDQELSVVFYDLTTVKVHGEAVVDGDVRDFGKSKDGGVARQFVLSLVQTADGLPIAHEVHPGNTAEAKTLLPMIRSLLERWPLKRVVLVADRGLLSLNNLQELAQLQAQLDAAGRGVRLE